ncbi:hypothetical protein KFD70_24910 [Bacillus pfraonensis]|uniref:hypothetical protein n=1 Tax=Bacillus TaxID=1386 RepID=UPI003012F239
MNGLLKVFLFKTGEQYPLTIKYMPFSDFKVYHEYVLQYGLNYDNLPQSDIREKYVLKDVDFVLVKQLNESEPNFEVYLTFQNRIQ